MKTKITGYLSVLNSQNPASIGGAMPNDNFTILRISIILMPLCKK